MGNHGGRRPERKRLLVSLGTVKPMVDGLDLIARVMDSASEVDAEIILHISANARSDLRSLPSNVRLVDWIPMGVFLNGADGFIHHGGAGNTLDSATRWYSTNRLRPGADRPVNAALLPNAAAGLSSATSACRVTWINAFLNNRSLRKASEEVAAEMAAQPCP